MPEPRSSRSSLRPDELEKILARVEDVRFRRGQLEAEIDRVLGVEQTVEELESIYRELGEDVSEEVIREAIDGYVQQYGRFDAPRSAVGVALARLWISRVWVAAGLLVVAGTAGVWGAVRHANAVRAEALEVERVAKLAAATCAELDQTREAARTVTKMNPDQPAAKLSPALRDATPAFCTPGTVTSANRLEVERNIRDLQPVIGEELAKLRAVQQRAEARERAKTQRADLERLITRIRATGAPISSLETAEQEYAAAVSDLQRDPPSNVAGAIHRLEQLERELNTLAEYAAAPEKLIAQIRAVSKEPDTTAEAQRLSDRAVAARQSGQAAELKESVEALQAIHDELEREYVLVIFGGDWRFPRNNRNARNYYLLVEAREGRDGNGAVLRMPILNEETGATWKVCGWGERVRQDDYDRVAADKKDNGIIDHNVFGRKSRGYSAARIERSFHSAGGRITEWEKGQQPKTDCK